MEKINTAILMKESKFDLHELFFSITQHDSTILFGNETFIRISGYEKDEIIGKFHNIIRHQDMPRVIFKKFWEYLKLNKPVVAYVKNKTKDGGFYWVLAVVFPMEDRYISIRIKPNTAIFTVVREIYFRLLMAEAKSDMDESQKLFIELLNAYGFDDYDHFMNEVLLAELLERKRLLTLNRSQEHDYSYLKSDFKLDVKSLYDISKVLLNEYEKWFTKIESLKRIKSIFEDKGYLLRTLARDIVFLSLNASVSSYKLESDGETFGVLASDIRTNAKQNDILIRNVHKTTQSFTESINEMIFLVSYLSLQMEMVTYFIKELLDESSEKLNENINILNELVMQYNEKLIKLPNIFDKLIRINILNLEELEKQLMYLGYVQVYGIIESSRLNDDRLGFCEIFSQLKALISKTSDEISLMKDMAENFNVDNKNLMNDSKKIEVLLNSFKSQIIKMKKMEI
ncbi:MAG: hypothetical protein A2513_07700 [Sulfurimonas sp. RIFOXYD12_FULL_33_39]|uniref:PAS domain-containing protein n=1 Tax=unclassified Sulfurimonas TaxID=2623549 RepID=UPI0008B0C7BF|nr:MULTISPECIES: PAS domain-containing protein [unclassified Sulfurimonas]OHE09978.1 MAG: hypothetical protein A2513_07700 [Sulfurimonas sp. RIFOXYD12_FULL_33_39]OHE14802.1 MAG: hypothetical protein A2530_02780 [Sulfurimonas sp. RIFOXYD2_FULL_34_21]